MEIGKLDTGTVNLILDELMRAAVDGGMGSMRCEKVAELMTPLNSINVRGRVLARVRKVWRRDPAVITLSNLRCRSLARRPSSLLGIWPITFTGTRSPA